MSGNIGRLVGYTSTTFLRSLDSTANPEFERVVEGCAVIRPLEGMALPFDFGGVHLGYSETGA
jgi:hypothetical protein